MIKNDKSSDMSSRILEVTIAMIDAEGDIHGVNLRSVAKNAGCAHTNVYNYFDSFENLLWCAFGKILENWMNYTKENLDAVTSLKDSFAGFIRIQIDFALLHSGWYRFIWLEPFAAEVPDSVRDRFQLMQVNFAKLISSTSPRKLTIKRAKIIEEMIHGYLHGELCKLINQRVFQVDHEYHKKRITENCKSILQAMVNNKGADDKTAES